MKQKSLILLELLIFLSSCSTTLKSKTEILKLKYLNLKPLKSYYARFQETQKIVLYG